MTFTKKQRRGPGRPPGLPTDRLTVHLPIPLMQAIREEAAARNLTLSALVLEAFESRARIIAKVPS